jgi:hypothetical protein
MKKRWSPIAFGSFGSDEPFNHSRHRKLAILLLEYFLTVAK